MTARIPLVVLALLSLVPSSIPAQPYFDSEKQTLYKEREEHPYESEGQRLFRERQEAMEQANVTPGERHLKEGASHVPTLEERGGQARRSDPSVIQAWGTGRVEGWAEREAWDMLEKEVLEARYGILIVRGPSHSLRWYTDDGEAHGFGRPARVAPDGALRAKWGDPYAITVTKGRDYVLIERTVEQSKSSIGGSEFYTVTLRFKVLPHRKLPAVDPNAIGPAPVIRGKPVERGITLEEDLNRTER